MRQIKRVAIMGTVGMMGLVMWTVQGAEPYPNPHRIVRYLDAEADTTVNGRRSPLPSRPRSSSGSTPA